MLVPSRPLDVRFWAFSRRTVLEDETGPVTRVCGPKALYASSSVLKQTDYFKSLLSGGFAESSTGGSQISLFPQYEISYVDDYDYEDDSDLEDDDDEVDTDSEDGSPRERATDLITDDTSSTHSSDYDEFEYNQSSHRPCRQIIIRDTAYDTLRALLCYLHTGEIKFRGLLSGESDNFGEDSLPPGTDGAACSPKSMYRLAEKLGLTELENLALKAIEAALTPSNILTEVVCEFTSLYPAVLEAEINYLCKHYHDPEVASRWGELIGGLCRGDNPHAASMLMLLLQRLAPSSKAASARNGASSAADSAPCEDDLPDWIECSYGGWAAALRG